MIDPGALTGTQAYVRGSGTTYMVLKTHYNRLEENQCYVTLDIESTPSKGLLDTCVSFTSEYKRDFNNSYGQITFECTFKLSDISEVPFGSPLAQVIYGGN